ncbi:MAG: YkgJ family cysteine cluster protein [Myxococcales bacterium]
MEQPTEAWPECLRCGACCFGDGERYVPVTGDDHARLGDNAEALTVFIGNRCYMRMEQGHCAALQLTRDGAFICSVYPQRPETCRELARGGAACQAELQHKSERSQRALLHVLATDS